MKSAGFQLSALVVAGCLTAREPPPAVAAKTSSRLAQEIRVALPQFSPPPQILDQPKSIGLEDDPNVLALPKVTVRDKVPPGHDPDLWLTDFAIQQKAMVQYRQSLSDFDWMLNSWFIPLFTPPASARARAAYEEGKFHAEVDRLRGLIDRIGVENPKASARLRIELGDMLQTQDWLKRPAGMSPGK